MVGLDDLESLSRLNDSMRRHGGGRLMARLDLRDLSNLSDSTMEKYWKHVPSSMDNATSIQCPMDI